MKAAVLLILTALLCAASVNAKAETWVEMLGGHFTVPVDTLGRIQATIEAQVTSAAKAQGQDIPPWKEYLVQYRATEVNGRRAVEIHGSCHFHGGADLRKQFYDEH